MRRAGGRVVFAATSIFSVATVSPGVTAASVGFSPAFAGTVVGLNLLAVHRQPPRHDQHLPLGFERLTRHARDAGGHEELGGGIEGREKALDDEIVELGFELVQVLGRNERGDDREVIGDLRVVEDPLVGPHPLLLQHFSREHAVELRVGKRLHRRLHGADVVLRQRARIRARVGERLVFLIERLREGQGRAGGEPEAAVGLALQRRQVVEQRGALCRGLRLLGHLAGLAGTFRGDRVRLRLVPQALGAGVGVVLGLRPPLVEPASRILAGAGAERAEDFPIAARPERTDLLLPLDHDGERRRLHAADGRQLKPAGLRVERRHRPRAVDPDEPIGLGAADGGVSERAHLRVGAQLVESLANCGGRHGLQPEAPDRFRRFRELHDVAEDEFAFAASVAGIDQVADVLALDESQQRFQPVLVLFDRLQCEFRRDRRQVAERPFAALDFLFLGHADLEQMPDRRRQHVFGALEVIVVARKTTQCARDVGGDGGFLGDDQRFRHGRAVRRAADSTEGEAGGARTALPRTSQRVSARPRARVPAREGMGRHPKRIAPPREADEASVGAGPLSTRPTARKALRGPAGGSEHQALGRGTAQGWSREAGCGEAAHSEREARSTETLPEPARQWRDLLLELERCQCPDRGGDRKRGARCERVDIRGIVPERAQHRAHGGVGFGACVRGPPPAGCRRRRIRPGCPARSRRASRPRESACARPSRTGNGSSPAARTLRGPVHRRVAR